MHLETFFADAWNALRQLTRDQNERFRAIRNPLDAVDYLSFGAISANRQRYGEMLEDPSFHTVGNWLTLGLFDTVKGALDPEEPMSFQHVMDLAGLLGVVTSVYKAGSRVAGMSDPEDVLRRTQQGNQGARVADDAVEAADDAVDLPEELGNIAQIGDDFGKIGRLVENPGIEIDWSNTTTHGLQRMAERGVTQEMANAWAKGGKALQQAGEKILYVTRQGAVVVDKVGKVLTAYTSGNFDENMEKIVQRLFGK